MKNSIYRRLRLSAGTLAGESLAATAGKDTLRPAADARAGFTLIELMMSLALSSVLILAVVNTYITTGRMMESSRIRNNLSGNMRVAMDYMMRDLTLAGYGFLYNERRMGDWVYWVNQATNPVSVTGSSGASKALQLIGAFERPASLSAAADSGEHTIVVDDASRFNTGNRGRIFIGGAELARITAIAGNTLTISTDPANETGLRWGHAAGAPIDLVQVITYSVTNHARQFYLIRSNPAEPAVFAGAVVPWDNILASDIVHLEVEPVTNQAVRFHLTGRSQEPDRMLAARSKDNNPYLTITNSTEVLMRNPTRRR